MSELSLKCSYCKKEIVETENYLDCEACEAKGI